MQLITSYFMCIIFTLISASTSKVYIHLFDDDHACIIRIPKINDDNFKNINVFIPDNNNTYLLNRFSAKQNDTTNVFITYEILYHTQNAIFECALKLGSFLSQHVNKYFLSKVENITVISQGVGSQIAGISSTGLQRKYKKIIALNPYRFFFSNKNINSRLDRRDAEDVHVIYTFVHENFLHTSSQYNRLLGNINFYFREAFLNDGNCNNTCKNNNAVDYLYDSIFLNRTFTAVRCSLQSIFKQTCNISNSITFVENLNLLKQEGVYLVYNKSYENTINIEQHTKSDYYFLLILLFIVVVVCVILCTFYFFAKQFNDDESAYYITFDYNFGVD